MCIALLSTAHPLYPFILLNNRDEFLDRPTAQADWWDAPNQHVLGGRDLQNKERGTWLAVTKQGRVAVLTNFREDGDDRKQKDRRSRGAIVNAYLTSDESPAEFHRRMVNDFGVQYVGGFSLLFGELKSRKEKNVGLSILSNRSASADTMPTIATEAGEIHGLSNSHFGDTSWPKVVHGELLLKQAIHANVAQGDDEDTLIEKLFDILSVDNLPKRKTGEDWDTYVRQMRNSIFIPPVGGPAVEGKPGDTLASGTTNGVATPEPEKVQVGEGGYGTQKQTVMLVDKEGRVKFVERTLYDENGRRTKRDEGQKIHEFEIEGWQG